MTLSRLGGCYMNREKCFNIMRTFVSMIIAVIVAFTIIMIVSDEPIKSIRLFLQAHLLKLDM